MSNKTDDEIVEEIRLVREAHAKALDYDPERIVEDLQREEKDSGESVIECSPRIPKELSKRTSA